jgi:NADH:ubiquinone oxidoreductase subunit E/ferredoxin
MMFIPVLIISLILLVITILLSIADKLLVSYGECKITVRQDDEVKEFVVPGGGYLHTELTKNDISVTSSCGGKATCGYCKVQLDSGGGEILPTEEIFMDREEKLGGMRLACQVKVKDDLEIRIPDFLTTVKGIVKNKSYDAKLRWNFLKSEQEDMTAQKVITKLTHDERKKLDEIISEYKDIPGATIPILQKVSSSFNYLPEPVLRYTAKIMNKPASELYRIATFYNSFSLTPRGKYVINICMGTACHVKGATGVLEAFERELGIKKGQTTKDMLFTVDTVMCLGCCGLAPVLKVNENVHGLMTKREVPKLIKKYREAQNEKA